VLIAVPDTISVLIPSRLRPKNSVASAKLLIDNAIESIRWQTVASRIEVQIIIGIDTGASIPPKLAGDSGLGFAQSGGKTQAAALNAAAKLIAGHFVAILEDDDQWHPLFLEYALSALAEADFVSSTQLEIGLDEIAIRINDFPTPSGWLMKRATWDAVGAFNESFRWHLDNEWLGRLAQQPCKRAHLVEATAPINPESARQVRPWLANCLRLGGPSVRLVRHGLPWPLVKRLVHPGSGMQRISVDPNLTIQSQNELKALVQTFGRIPW
jgi:glycosyltransferase involved in cell wall biosynthesis